MLHASLGFKTAVIELKQEAFLDEIMLKLEKRVALKAQVFRAVLVIKWMLGVPWILVVGWFQSAESGSAVLQQPPEGKVKKYRRPFQTRLVAYIYTLFSLLSGRPWTSLKSRAVWWCLACRDTQGQRKHLISHPSPSREVGVGSGIVFSSDVFFQQRDSQFYCRHLSGGAVWRTAAVVVLYSLGSAKQASSCWEALANPLSSY